MDEDFDWSAFLLEVTNGSAPSDAAMIALRKPLERLARLIGRSYGFSLQSWLLDEAWGRVCEAILKEVGKAAREGRTFTFANVRHARAFCGTVLRHCLISEWRTRRAITGVEGFEKASESDLLDRLSEQDLAEKFADENENLRAIEEWPPIRRVLAMCMSGLWRKIPSDLWHTWVSEARIADRRTSVRFNEPFPSEELHRRLLECCDRHARILALEAAGIGTKNTLQVMWGEAEADLWKLKFIQGML